jgi:hypothetical protein
MLIRTITRACKRRLLFDTYSGRAWVTRTFGFVVPRSGHSSGQGGIDPMQKLLSTYCLYLDFFDPKKLTCPLP